MRIQSETQYIKQLVEEGEHEHQDFKFEISDARKIARSISAFANTGGGRLLVGVKDNGKIAGIRSEEEIYMIEAAATMYCEPKVEVVPREGGYIVALGRLEDVEAKVERWKKFAEARVVDMNGGRLNVEYEGQALWQTPQPATKKKQKNKI
jgi:hypothetical protein